MSDFGISPEDLRRLARLVEENGLSELRYEEGDLRVTLRTAAYARPSGPAAAPPSLPAPLINPDAEWAVSSGNLSAEAENGAGDYPATAEVGEENLLRIEAPVMGVFYRSPAPGEPSFVDIGDTVEIGQPVGIIEAMKVFSEVLSEVAGRVVDVPAKSGALVQPGDVLVLLEEEEG